MIDENPITQLQVESRSAEALYDYIDDTVFFVKDRLGRYVVVNQTIAKRCGLDEKHEAVGRTAEEVFPNYLGESYSQQDREVIESRIPLQAELEQHLNRDCRECWCLTWKIPLFAKDTSIIGLVGMSRDLGIAQDSSNDMKSVATVLRHVKNNLAGNIQIDDLVQLSGLSAFQLDNRIKNLLGVSTGQHITQSRIEFACFKLKNTTDPIVEIAKSVGYNDASAFTRQFRKTVGVTPSLFRSKYHQLAE